MKAGVDVLIEKPLAATLAEADELVALAATHKRIAPGRTSRALQSGGAGDPAHC